MPSIYLDYPSSDERTAACSPQLIFELISDIISARKGGIVPQSEIERRIAALVVAFEEQEVRLTGLPLAERVAIALVLNRPELIDKHLTILEAVDRLGPEWTRAALAHQRANR